MKLSELSERIRNYINSDECRGENKWYHQSDDIKRLRREERLYKLLKSKENDL